MKEKRERETQSLEREGERKEEGGIEGGQWEGAGVLVFSAASGYLAGHAEKEREEEVGFVCAGSYLK